LIDLKCPTLSVFAWEYSNIPNETWDDDVRNDWRVVFARHGRALTLSSYTARTVKDAMGAAFPVLALPAPLWEQYASARARFGGKLPARKATLQLRGTVIDSHLLGLSADGLIAHLSCPAADAVLEQEPPPAAMQTMPESPVPTPAPAKGLRYRLAVTKRHLLTWYREALRDLLPLWLARTVAVSGRGGYALARALTGNPVRKSQIESAPPAAVTPVATPSAAREPETVVNLDGVIYTSILSPKDGRKNWFDMVTAFCWTFRDVEDATLVLKMNERDLSIYHNTLLTLLSQLAPFKCRVVTLHAYLDDATYEELIGATSFYVNTSLCEGLCLPLMEFMCCGKPVIAPVHTAMEDYIDDGAAFIVKSSLEHNVWPHDPRDLFRTLRYRLDWESICTAYKDSYRVAKQQPEQYIAMSEHAMARQAAYCSGAVVKEQLHDFFLKPGVR
jgi:glycosyltransferase involved in cell wall biosynthesis